MVFVYDHNKMFFPYINKPYMYNTLFVALPLFITIWYHTFSSSIIFFSWGILLLQYICLLELQLIKSF